MTVRIMQGHVLDQLALLEDGSVHCVVSSPPYYGLRSYRTELQIWGGDAPGCEHEWGAIQRTKKGDRNANDGISSNDAIGAQEFGQGGAPMNGGNFCHYCSAWKGDLGLEPTLDLYLDHMLEVFREVRRVMRKDGTLWLNIGDSYAQSSGRKDGINGRDTEFKERGKAHGYAKGSNFANYGKRIGEARSTVGNGFKPKDLMLIPSRLAIRLCDDGWWVRKDVILAKRAPMPESCKDRPTSSHEHLFLLTKSPQYFYDRIAVAEPSETHPKERYGARSRVTARGLDGSSAEARGHDRNSSGGLPNADPATRNMRDVWWLSPEPLQENHYAAFVSEIPRRAILAGTSAKGVCSKCGAPWKRVVDRKSVATVGEIGVKGKQEDHRNQGRHGGNKSTIGRTQPWSKDDGATKTLGWRPTCECDAGDPIPATVLDPFLGSGTTALVADQLDRDCIGIELSPNYAAMAERRLRKDAGMFAEVATR